jgi:plasmid stability protein
VGIKNLTLTIDEDLLAKARVLAAMKRTSVNEMVRSFLAKAIEDEKARDEVSAELMRLARDQPIRLEGPPVSRDTLYAGEQRFDR